MRILYEFEDKASQYKAWMFCRNMDNSWKRNNKKIIMDEIRTGPKWEKIIYRIIELTPNDPLFEKVE